MCVCVCGAAQQQQNELTTERERERGRERDAQCCDAVNHSTEWLILIRMINRITHKGGFIPVRGL